MFGYKAKHFPKKDGLKNIIFSNDKKQPLKLTSKINFDSIKETKALVIIKQNDKLFVSNYYINDAKCIKQLDNLQKSYNSKNSVTLNGYFYKNLDEIMDIIDNLNDSIDAEYT